MSRLAAVLRSRLAAARAEHLAQIEDSWLPRATSVAAVLVALAGVALADVASAPDLAVAIVLVPVGNLVSHRRRRRRNHWIKVALVVAVAVVLARFFSGLASITSVDDARQPLTDLFLGVQTLHAFDLPRRRDLTFTVSASLGLIVMAAAGVRGLWFAPLLVAWLVAAWASLWLLRLSAAYAAAGRVLGPRDVRPPPRQRRRVVPLARRATAIVAVAALGFLLVPRPEPQRTVGLPFRQLTSGIPSPLGITNPGLPADGPDDVGGPFDPVAYFGLAESVDVRTVGELSDEVVLRVRSSRPRLLRGMVFDHYEGSSWTRTATAPELLRGLPVELPPPTPAGPRIPVVQTVEVVTDTPNLVFAAGDPVELYHAGRAALRWSDGTVSVGSTQSAGTVYSVVSSVVADGEAALRAARGPVPAAIADRWLQVPDELSARTRALAAELVDPTATPYANAESVQTWIGDHVTYRLDLSPPPPGTDAVDRLLFDTRAGWCEPIATSMVMLLRLGGVPARFATGFQPGDYDLLSGWWTVRADKAHAWVEVWVPGHGWVSFDPTGAVPAAAGPTETVVTWPLAQALERLAAALHAVPVPVRVGLVLVVVAMGAIVVLRRRRRHLEQPLAHLGVPWEPWETATDLRRRLAGRADRQDLDVLVACHHARVTGAPTPPPRTVRRATHRVRRSLRRDRIRRAVGAR